LAAWTALVVERKLAAILAADIAGYSRLMRADEEGTLNALRARREVVEGLIVARRGRVFGSAGDSVVAEFPSAVEAIHAAVEIQAEMARRNELLPKDKRLQFRIGINIGDVMAEAANVFGDGVNVAARLEALAEPGGICVARNVYNQVKNKVGVGFESLGKYQVKNIAEPVSVYRVLIAGTSKRPRVLLWLARLSRRRGVVGALTALVLLAAGGLAAWYLQPRETLPPNSFPTIAVLPFANMSSDPALGYFADGVTETIISGLSRSPQIRVTARTSTDAYKGKAADIRQIGQELGAHYVLEGSVQKGSDKVRIVAQLIDASTGDHVWADRYDREGGDALALQDDVTERIVASLAGEVGLIKKHEYERAWGKDSASVEEYDYYLRGHQLFMQFTKESTLQAIALWQEGLERFPDSALLRVKLGWGYYQLTYGGWSTDVGGDLQRAFDLSGQGLASKSLSPVARLNGHQLMAFLQLVYKKDYDQALKEREVALALAPNDPLIVGSMAEVAIQAGRPDDAIASLSRDIPRDSDDLFSSPYYRLGFAYFVKGDYQKALEYLKQERHEDPVNKLPFLAATYAELGAMDEARAAVAKIRAANPAVSLELIREVWPLRDKADTERLADALRKAGLPER
jgi:TolB-like protein/class 3 adenylate cyclase